MAFLALTPQARAEPTDLVGYEEELAAAISAYRRQAWDEARARFEAAHERYANARTLRGMGASAFEAGHFALAVRDLEAARIHPERPLDPGLSASVAALIEQARSRLAIFALIADPPSAEVRVDGEAAVRSAQGEILLESGRHRIQVEASGYSPHAMELDVSAGQRETLRVALGREESQRPPPELTRPAVDHQEQPGPAVDAASVPQVSRIDVPLPMERGLGIRVNLAIVASTLFAVSTVAAGTVYAVGEGRVGAVINTCRAMAGGRCSQAEADSLLDTQNVDRLERTTTAMFSLAVASAVIGGTFWISHMRQKRRRTGHARFVPRFYF